MQPRALTSPGRRLWRGAVLAGVAALALTGCMKFDVDLELQSDDTVDGSMTVAMTSALAELSGEDPEAFAEQMREEMLADAPFEDARTEPYDDGEFIGTTVHFTDAPLDSFGEGGEDEASLSIVREGDEFVVSGIMDLSGEGSELGGFAEPEIRFAVTFPGAVTEHTGELEGRTVTWDAAIGEVTEISARGGAEAGVAGLAGNLLWIVVAVAVVLLVAGIVVAVVLVRRRKAAPAQAGYPADAAYVTGAGTAYPDGTAQPTPQTFAPPAPQQYAAPTEQAAPQQYAAPTEQTPPPPPYAAPEQPAPGSQEPDERPQQ